MDREMMIKRLVNNLINLPPNHKKEFMVPEKLHLLIKNTKVPTKYKAVSNIQAITCT